MKNETYIEIIQNLVDINTKEDLQKKCSEVVSKFDEIDKTFIRNTATPFIMSLVGLQDTNKDFSKDLAFDICERKELKEIFKNKDDLKIVFKAYTIHFAIYCKEKPKDVENIFGIFCKTG